MAGPTEGNKGGRALGESDWRRASLVFPSDGRHGGDGLRADTERREGRHGGDGAAGAAGCPLPDRGASGGSRARLARASARRTEGPAGLGRLAADRANPPVVDHRAAGRLSLLHARADGRPKPVWPERHRHRGGRRVSPTGGGNAHAAHDPDAPRGPRPGPRSWAWPFPQRPASATAACWSCWRR